MAQAPREELLADLRDLGRERRRIVAPHEAVLIVERGGEQLEERAVALLVHFNAGEVADERRWKGGVVLGQRSDAVPAEPGGLLRVDVELAEAPERPVLEGRPHLFGHAADEPPDGRDRARERSREGCVAPLRVHQHRARPPADAAGELAGVGLHPQKRPAQAQDRPADVDRVHLFVLPRPDERVAKDLSHLGRDRHRGQPARDRVFAVADGDDLLALEREQKQVEHLLSGTVGPPFLPFGEPLFEFLVDGSHATPGACGTCRDRCASGRTM